MSRDPFSCLRVFDEKVVSQFEYVFDAVCTHLTLSARRIDRRKILSKRTFLWTKNHISFLPRDKEKENPVKDLLNAQWYLNKLIEDMTDEQKTMMNHIQDLTRKITASQFNLEQLNFGKNAFVNSLSLKLILYT